MSANDASRPTPRQKLGSQGEKIAADFLRKRGYQIMTTNYRSPRWGELDIIGLEADTVVFVEVKTRRSQQRVPANQTITPRKVRTLKRTARSFIYQHSHPGNKLNLPQAYRLDLVTVIFSDDDSNPKVKLYKNICSF